MDIVRLAQTRYTTKHYDASRRITPETLSRLMEVLRLAPSSVNSQPWHYFIAQSDAAKHKIMPAVLDFNRPRIEAASHIIIFCVHEDLDESYLQSLLKQEISDGRYTDTSVISGLDAGRRHFVELHRSSSSEIMNWQTHQAYLAMGFLLFAAASEGIDSTALEGLDMPMMDQILNLKSKRLRTVGGVALGYRDCNDSNATRPKSRWPSEQIFSFID